MQTPLDFDEWARARLPHLTRFARTLTADEHAAADLVQDTLERALLSWHRIEGNPEAYVRRAMVNRSISVWRKHRREHPTDTVPDRAVTDDVRDQTLLDALRSLAPRQRAVVALRYLDDLSEAQTAELLGCSVGTVKSQASAAMKTLRARLEDIEVDTPAVLSEVHAGAAATRRRRGVAAVVGCLLAVAMIGGGTLWATRTGHTDRPVGPLTSPSATRTTSTTDPSSTAPLIGSGVSVTLSDASESLRQSGHTDPNLMIVHRQDVQAVVDALWRGGADAVTLQGRPITRSTTITSSGYALTVDGASYSGPFVIQAVGDGNSLVTALNRDKYVKIFRTQAADPTIGIGWSLKRTKRVVVPAS